MTRFIGGLSLGQQRELTALVIVETYTIPDPNRHDCPLNRFDVRQIFRWPLGTKYPQIVEDLKQMYSTPKLRETTLLVDGTGVGKAVTDLFLKSGIMARLRPFVITAGFKRGDGTVPKTELIGATIAASQQRRIRYAEGLKFGPILEKELETFTTKLATDRNESFAAWREKDKDDLVLALSLAVWHGARTGSGYVGVPEPPPFSDLPPGTFYDMDPDIFGRDYLSEAGGLPRDTFD